MSKAFTREENEGPDGPELRPLVSTLPAGAKNYMTRGGADRLREELTNLVEIERPKLAASANEEAKGRLSTLDQRIFQLQQSLQSAEVVSLAAGPAGRVTFGATVTVRAKTGDESIYRIVGADETDFDCGWVSWVSPIAKALINAKVGEVIRFKFPSGEKDLEIIEIKYE
jgi:transcription elongation factor GreB